MSRAKGAPRQTTECQHAEHGSDESQIEAAVQKSIDYLFERYAEPVSISLMAKAIGYNRAYLSKRFKQATGLSPVTFLLRLRLDIAQRLLLEQPELTTTQIAASVGIHDPVYFSRQFRRQYGKSPTEYRKACSSP